MSQVIEPSVGEQARNALDSHAWQEAFDLLSKADVRDGLTADELDLLADASWWVGRLPKAIEVRERAYAAHVKAGNKLMAAAAAAVLVRDNLIRSAFPEANGWLNRADRLLEGLDEGPVHGWVGIMHAYKASLEGHYDDVFARASKARDIAALFGDRDLDAVALNNIGLSLVHRGEVEKGLAMIDEATVAAVSGETEPATGGAVCCSTIETCAALGDWQRAAQWTEAQDRWCKREQINGFPGMCRLYRAEVKQLRGAWLEAEAEARRASDELAGFIPNAVGVAMYDIGLIRLRRGDLPAAREALVRAHTFGRHPEPALSLLKLAEGNVEGAKASITRALEDPDTTPSMWAPPGSQLNRLALLPAQVEIAVAAGDLDLARKAVDEFAEMSERYAVPAVLGNVSLALGAVLLAEANPQASASELRKAIQIWSKLDAPYEVARGRLLLAQAQAASGDAESAAMEVEAARAAFERLGAATDERRAAQLLASIEGRTDGATALPAAGERVARAFLFTDIVDSTRLAELLGDEAWNAVLRWHDQALRSLIAEHGGEEIKRTGDGFFMAFSTPDAAIECAVAIQRRLVDQQQTQGFAPAVRIGAHWAEATRSGLDYIGGGVNQASRIGAMAGGAEILVSAAMLEIARRAYAELDRRTVSLKGIAQPVEVVSIGWR